MILNGLRYTKFHCIHVKNNGTTIAKRCVAKLKIIEAPHSITHLDENEEYKLHWADIDYSYRTDEPEPIDIGSERRRLDVFFSQYPNTTNIPPGVNINDIFSSGTLMLYSGDSTTVSTPLPTPAGSTASPSPTPAQLDSWIAVPIALSNPAGSHQYELPPGRYRINIRIDWEKGDGIEQDFEIIIIPRGQNNSLNRI